MIPQIDIDNAYERRSKAVKKYYAGMRAGICKSRRVPAPYKSVKQACYFLHQEEKSALGRLMQQIEIEVSNLEACRHLKEVSERRIAHGLGDDMDDLGFSIQQIKRYERALYGKELTTR